MKKSILAVLFLALCSFGLQAQDVQLKGKITAFNTYNLQKVLVETSKSKQSVLTDSLGNFVIMCQQKDRLKITAAGFIKQHLRTRGDTTKVINLVFKDSKSAKNKAIAAGHISREDLEFGIKFKTGENNNYASYRDIFEMIQILYPKVRIDGDTGERKLYLTSRGPQTLIAGEEALLVVDGVVANSISGLSPVQVDRIRVLMGVECSAYGTRGGCGVIEIDLKY